MSLVNIFPVKDKNKSSLYQGFESCCVPHSLNTLILLSSSPSA